MKRDCMRRDRLLVLAEFLRDLPNRLPHAFKFDMDSWGVFDDGVKKGDAVHIENYCGSIACAMGWATAVPSFRRAGLQLVVLDVNGGKASTYPMFRGNEGYLAATELFGISRIVAHAVFSSHSKAYTLNDTKITIDEVAGYLELLAASDEATFLEMVDYDHA